MTPANLGFVEMLLLPFSTVFYQPFCQYFISLTIHATSDWIENHFEENNRLQLISGKYLPRIENRTQAIFMCVILDSVQPHARLSWLEERLGHTGPPSQLMGPLPTQLGSFLSPTPSQRWAISMFPCTNYCRHWTCRCNIGDEVSCTETQI